MNVVNDARSENADQSPRRGDRDVPRRGDRAGSGGRRDNSSYGERRGKRYDGSSPRRGGDSAANGERRDGAGRSAGHERGNDGERAGGRSGGRSAGGGGYRSSDQSHGRSAQRSGGPRRASRPGERGSDGRGTNSRREGSRGDGDRRNAGDRRNGPVRRSDGDRHGAGRPGQEVRAAARADEPALPEDIEASDLDMEIRRDLRSLDKSNAEIVAKHLVAAMHFVDEDPELALAHGRAAKNRAGRIGVVRETLGVLAYRAAEWSEALGELRAARRISGGPGLLAMMADCERGLERPQRAIELARGDESRMLEGEDLIELRIVEAGARVDMGQLDAALVTLKDAGLSADAAGEEAARLDYAYAEVLLAAGRKAEAIEWFGHAVEADPEQLTDAEARLAELVD